MGTKWNQDTRTGFNSDHELCFKWIFLTQVHDIDLMTYILGEYPTEVYTVANGQIPEIAEMKDFDNVVSTFKFKSGSTLLFQGAIHKLHRQDFTNF